MILKITGLNCSGRNNKLNWGFQAWL